MKNKIYIMKQSIILLYMVFFASISAFEYLEIALYKKEISLLLGLTSATLLYLFEEGGTTKVYKKYPVIFWLTLPAPLLFGWRIYSELVNN